jgi:hypothetical protein
MNEIKQNTGNYRIRKNKPGIGGWETVGQYNSLADFRLGIQNLEMVEGWSYFNEQEIRTLGTISDENGILIWSSPHYRPY